MNLRKDHYPSKTSCGRGPTLTRGGARRTSAPFLYEHLRSPSAGQPAVGIKQNLFLHLALPVLIQTIVTTFNNGSLGSGIDEERSEMR